MNRIPSDWKQGLSEAEAQTRLAQFGANRLREASRFGALRIAAETFKEPMFLLLLVATALYLLFGALGEGLFLLAGAFVSIGLVILQRLRSERALAALNALAEPMVRVVREGAQRLIPATQLVPGDLFVVAEGSRLPADAVLVSGDALSVDESALTGEAAPVTRLPGTAQDDAAQLSAGTMVTRGHGLAVVRRTGEETRFGQIGTSLVSIAEEPTLLQKNVGRLIARIGLLALLFCILVTAAYSWLRTDWFAGALAGITLAIALLPEEFPMVLAVFMALGAWRLARRNVLVRHSAVIETLGATTLLCVDKTGTLTENRMSLAGAWLAGQFRGLPNNAAEDDLAELLLAARRASALHSHDAMDAAVHDAATSLSGWQALRSFPLRPDRLAFVHVWRSPSGETVYAAKGAPEAIIRMCALDPELEREIEEAFARLARRGMRVLGVAEARFALDKGLDPGEVRFGFLGLLGFADPIRGDVPLALAEARRAGVRVVMVTGDYPETALAIARDAGIDTSAGVMTGAELASGAPPRADVQVFARIMPDQKLDLVQAFKAAGHVVAMTGDGINDAPALAAAHIGIAMGRRGTDVAREAADLILLDDRFASIIGGIRHGRRIFSNLRRAMSFITAVHVPIAGLALLPILLGLPPLLYPMHVVLLELLVDPMCSLAFESEPGSPAEMAKPPRPAGEILFGYPEIARAGVQGLFLLAPTVGLYIWGLNAGFSTDEARTSAFVALIAGNFSLALANASGAAGRLLNRRTAFWAIGGAALLIVTLCLSLPTLRHILQLAAPSAGFIALSALLGGIAGLAGLLALRPQAP